jgi:NAD(P)-dependent dehydrogenase (short-subunit alcohol dehydrogenase family)
VEANGAEANGAGVVMQSFAGKVALITGGSSGIGLGIAHALAAAGAQLALIGTNAAKLKNAVTELTASGAHAIGIQFDVTDQARWIATLDEVETQLGNIDLLVLNAGAMTRPNPIENVSLDEWRWIWDVNVNGVFYGLRATLPRMKQRQREAHILVTASIGAVMPRGTMGPYGASKAAVLALTEAVKQELAGSPIGISVMCPAGVKTAFNETAARNAPSANIHEYDWMKPTIADGMDPLKVGEFTLKCIREGRFYIFTHPGFKVLLEPRLTQLLGEFKDSADPGSTSIGA